MGEGASFYRGHRGGGDEQAATAGLPLFRLRLDDDGKWRKAPPFDRSLDHDHALVYDQARDWWTCGLAGCDHRVTGEAFASMSLPPAPVPLWLEGEEARFFG